MMFNKPCQDSVFSCNTESSFAEWIELPQFSDEGKIYRIPFDKYGQKLFNDNRDAPKIYEYPNGSVSSNDEKFNRRYNQRFPDEKTTMKAIFSLSQDFTTTPNFYATEIPQINEEHTEEAFVEVEEEESATQPILQTPETIFHDNQTYQPEVEDHEEIAESEANEDNGGNQSFMAYIPLELFKKVHAILQSQSTTVEGKIEFLQRFEKALLAEIEKRLVPVINPVRKKRESRGDHGWDDHHDESVGFPSLEGALLAIAFLTFAVYLVQLVMMLFRNLGNNAPAPNAGTATVLFNRNRRSIEEFTEETARILGYLDDFASNDYTDN